MEETRTVRQTHDLLLYYWKQDDAIRQMKQMLRVRASREDPLSLTNNIHILLDFK